MAEVAVKKRGRPKKVAVDDEVIVGVLEATTADEPKTRGKAASPSSLSLAKKSTSTPKAAITTSTTTSSTTARKTKVSGEDKKVTASTTATTPARKRATKSSSPSSTSTSSAIITNPVGKTATTATLESEKVEGRVVEAKSSIAENQKLSAEKEPATTTTIAGSAPTTTTTTTPTVVKRTRTAASAVKAEAASTSIPVSAQSEGQLPNQARLSKILQQAKAFSKHSDDLHRSLIELVGDREVAYASVLHGLETQTVSVKEIEALVSSENLVASVNATRTETATVTAAATSTPSTVASEQRPQQEKQNQTQNQNQGLTETIAVSTVQNEKGPKAQGKPKVTLEELVALVEAAVSATPPTAAPVSQGTSEAETIATVNQPALTTKATPDETMRQPPAIAPTVYIPSASMPLPSPQAWWSRPSRPRYVLPASTVTALAARGINTTNIQRQQPPSSHEPGTTSSGPSFPKRAGAGAGIGAGAGGFGAGGVSLPPSRPPPPPIQPKRPSEMPLKELQKDPKYRLLSSRWTRIMVALPVAIVSSYVLWERYEEQQAYRRAKEAKDRLERLGLGTSESNPYK